MPGDRVWLPNEGSRFTLHLALLVCLLTTSLGGCGCRSDDIRVRSWDDAVSFARAELETAGDLEERLEGYARSAANLSATIEVLERARPALELVFELRDVHVPVIGNGWQILLVLISLATVDGARIIATLEETLSALTHLKDSLDALSGLPQVADAVRAFRADPNRRTLVAMSTTSDNAIASLRRVHADLESMLDPLKDVSGNLSALVKGLRAAAGAGIPVVSGAAQRAVAGIGPIQEPLRNLRAGLDQLHQDIGADVVVLERIQEAMRQAREHEE